MHRFSRFQGAVALLIVSLCLVACGTGNEGVTPAPERNTSELFTVSALDGAGTYTPTVSVTEDGAGVTAVVTATGAAGLSGAAFHLNYDAGRYTPVSVEFGEFLGGEGEVLTFALTDLADYVPVAVAQIGSADVAPVNGSGTLATVRFSNEPAAAPRSISTAPLGDYNQVTDLAVIRQGSGTLDLHWTEVNVGDYDNNGYVLASDLVPLGLYYGQNVDSSTDPERVALADGNSNSLIEIGDITPIGLNYEHKLSGYMVYDDADGTSALSTGITIARATAQAQEENDDPNHPVKYTFTTEIPGADVQFTVRPVDDTELGNPGVASNPVTPEADENPPLPPTDLTATAGEGIGDRSVLLSWTASPSFDVQDYIIEYKMDSNGTWEEVTSVGASVTSFLHENDLFLENETYTYRIHAVDYTALESTYATSDPVTPWFFFLAAPTNLTATNEIAAANAIELNWDPPADDTGIFFYRVYDADTNEPLYTTSSKTITTFTHTGLTTGVTYTYYVKSVAADGGESAGSNLAGCVPSEITEINITALTTDKTTHCTDGSEPASNLSVTTDVAFDSVEWNCTLGSVTGSGTDVTWAAPAACSPQVVTITCTVHAGSGADHRDIKLYVTQYSIESQVDSGSGDFYDVQEQCISQQSSPYLQLATLFEGEGHAMIVSQWGLWCGYCKLEMPDFQEYMDWWGDDGLYVTGVDHWDTLSDVENWFNANNCPDLDTYIVPSSVGQGWFTHHNFASEGSNFGSAPMNVIYDRDGKCRWVKSGSLTYQTASKDKCELMLSQLVGQPIP